MSEEVKTEKPKNKGALVKAVLIGILVGVAFMLTAKFVNFAMM